MCTSLTLPVCVHLLPPSLLSPHHACMYVNPLLASSSLCMFILFCLSPCSCPTFSLCLLHLCDPLRVLPAPLQASACFCVSMLLFRPCLQTQPLGMCIPFYVCMCVVHFWLLSVYVPSWCVETTTFYTLAFQALL